MKELGIKSVIDELRKRNVHLEKMKALDFFAREGDWQTKYYADLVDSIDAWEIDPKFENKLRENLPQAKITIGDSHELARKSNSKYDIIVLDNPQSCYGNYCEHFDALESVLPLLSKRGIIIFNVKTVPFNYENNLSWKSKRNSFYGRDASSLDNEFLEKFYKDFFHKKKLQTEFFFYKERPQEFSLYSYVFSLVRENYEE